MKKKLLAILTSVLLLCAMLPLSAVGVLAIDGCEHYFGSGDRYCWWCGEETFSGTTGDCTWTLDGTHLTISGNGAMENFMPGGYSPWWDATSATIEEGVTSLGEFAFCDTLLEEITLPNSLTSLGWGTFRDSNLKTITIPENVKFIWGGGVFQNCTNLTSFVIPDTVTSIGESAFYGCTNLKSIVLPDTLGHIGDYAFYNCDSLTTINLPVGCGAPEVCTFSSCDNLLSFEVDSNNPYICDVDGVLFTKGKTDLCQYPSGRVGAYTVPDGVEYIWPFAFMDCYNLTSITIPRSTYEIGRETFTDCSSLTDVYYGGSEEDKINMDIPDYGNDSLLNATWHYNCVPEPEIPEDAYADEVQHSVMDTENGNGLAFRFELTADGVAVKNGNVVDLTGATVNYLGEDCKLVKMGAVVTNNATVGETKFTLDHVNDYDVLDIPAVYLCDLEPDSCSFAVRIINIPDTALERTIYARPYYIVEVDGEKIVVYGDVDSASCAEYM